MGYFIMPGDAKETLKSLPDNSVDSFVMDPPYDLTSIQKRFGKEGSAPAQYGTDGVYQRASRGFMGKTWDGTGIAFDVAFWEQVYRVLKPGGHVAAFGGSRTYHRMAVAIEDAGFEIRDSLFWVYGSGFPKSRDISKAIDKLAGAEREVVGEHPNPAGNKPGGNSLNMSVVGMPETAHITAPATGDAKTWNGWGTALKPAQEPIVLARKPISEGSIAANVLRWGTGAINIGGSKVGTDRVKTNGGAKFTGVFNPWTAKETTHHMGRWPANVLLTCCGITPHRPGCPILELDRQSGGRGNNFRPNRVVGVNTNPSMFGNRKLGATFADSGGASRYFANLDYDADLDDVPPFFYSAKASRKERDLGLDDLEAKGRWNDGRKQEDKDYPSHRGATDRTNTHPTVKPISVMAWLVKLITPPGGTVVDCFMGSGTTGMAAILGGFDFIGMELTDEYIPIATGRLAWAAKRKTELDAAPKQGTIFDALEGGFDETTSQPTDGSSSKTQEEPGLPDSDLVGSHQLSAFRPGWEADGDANDLPVSDPVQG